MALFSLFINLLLCLITHAKGPNIVMILTDDQDISIGGMNQMPSVTKLLINEGLTFKNAFVSSPICCVSRASILSGRYVHNHHTVNNSINGNCWSKYWQTDIEPTCFAASVEEAGYITFYAGKYLNQYGTKNAGGSQHVPVGWTDWKGLVGNSKYYNYNISDNGKDIHYANDYSLDYYTNLINNQSIQFLDTYANGSNSSFLMVLATPASHAIFTPAPQYNYTKETALRTPNFNYTQKAFNSSSKHWLLGMLNPMSEQGVYYTDYIYSQRHGTLRSVDDMVQNVYNKIKALGEIENTYWIYTSDHGFHSGQFGMGWDKRQLYENDIRIPFIVSGPGISANTVTNKIALNIDIAPTIIDLVGAKIPNEMDGQSLVPWFNDSYSEHVKQQFLIEYYGIAGNYNATVICADVYPDNIDGWSNYCDSWNNTYTCVRMIDSTKDIQQINGTIYCKFKCYGPGKVQVECDNDGSAQTYGEYYELENDYYELNNLMLALNETSKKMYDDLMQQLLSCSGQKQCNQLR